MFSIWPCTSISINSVSVISMLRTFSYTIFRPEELTSTVLNLDLPGSKKHMLIALGTFLLESGRSSFRPESGQKELQPKQMFELKFEVMANARGQI